MTTTKLTRRVAPRASNWRASRAAVLFILPCVAVFAVFLAYPLLRNSYISLFDWNGLTDDAKWIGLQNYVWLFTSPDVANAALNTLEFGLATIALQMGVGFLLAASLTGSGRLRQVLRTIFFVPVILTPVVVGFLYSKILEPTNGDLTQVLSAIGLKNLVYPWLADPHTALGAVILVNVWLWTGFSMSVYQSALATVPRELIEAARIDGASSRQLLGHVLIPFLRPTHYALLILSVIGTLKTFDIIYALTSSGPGNATELPTALMLRLGFSDYAQGKASAVGTILFLVALTFTVIQLRLSRVREASS